MALSAAMSSTASELNALGTTTTIDLYKRNIQGKSEGHYLKMSKVFTFMWGVLAILFASVANLFDNLIQLVNIIGSIFYGNVLGFSCWHFSFNSFEVMRFSLLRSLLQSLLFGFGGWIKFL